MDKDICTFLANTIDRELGGENKIWHGHPIWFLDGNPIIGYSKLPWGQACLPKKAVPYKPDTGGQASQQLNLDYRVDKRMVLGLCFGAILILKRKRQ